MAQLTIVDITGRAVHSAQITGKGTTHRERVSLRSQPVGTYMVRVLSQQRTLSGKVVLTR